MFETRFPQKLTQFVAYEAPLQNTYIDCWSDLEKHLMGLPDGLSVENKPISYITR